MSGSGYFTFEVSTSGQFQQVLLPMHVKAHHSDAAARVIRAMPSLLQQPEDPDTEAIPILPNPWEDW